MSDSSSNPQDVAAGPSTVAEVVRCLEPIGDLRRFVVDDLTPDEEDEFFSIIERA